LTVETANAVVDGVTGANLFLIDQHTQSLRHAVVEDDGNAAFLYLTAPQSTTIVASAWIYNSAQFPAIPPGRTDSTESDGSAAGAFRDSAGNEWTLRWSPDGHSVAVVANQFPLACILAAGNPGYSRGLRSPNALGRVWDDERYLRSFGNA
jgi:hypothetical protein